MNLTSTQRGILWMLLSSVCFSIMGVSVKELSAHLDSGAILFFRSLFTSLYIIGSIVLYKRITYKAGGKFALLIMRGILGSFAVLLIFYCIQISNIATAATFIQTTPIFIALFAYCSLKEKCSFRAIALILLGFVGVICITKYNQFNLTISLIGFGIGTMAALGYSSVKHLTSYYETRIIVLSFSSCGLLLSLILFLASEVGVISEVGSINFAYINFIMPSTTHWLFILIMGLFATFSQLCLTHAYSLAPASLISTIGYSAIPLTLLCDVIIYGKEFGLLSLLGIILVVTSSVSISRRSARA